MDDVVIEGQGFLPDPKNPFGELDYEVASIFGLEFSICKRNSRRELGYVSLTIQEPHTATLAYWMGAEGRGQGLTSEAALLITKFALGHLGLHRVTAELAVENVASRRVAEHAGLVVIGESRSQRPNGKIFDCLQLERADGPFPDVKQCWMVSHFAALKS